MTELKSFPKRLVAYKVRISDILNSILTRDEFFAGYIKMNNLNVSRVNIIATVVYKFDDSLRASLAIDDGTGRIALRSFENNLFFSKVDIGDVVLAIGKIREFNNEKYIMPEILRKINNIEWINVRKLELNHLINVGKGIIKADDLAGVSDIKEDVYSFIKKLDNGDGVAIEEVIKNFDNSEVENIIKKMLENGNIFEIKHGKLKVLE